MMQRFTITAVFLLIALVFSGNTAKAQELAGLPPAFQGNWALPDCGRYSEAVVFSRYFYLKASKEDQSLMPVDVLRQAGDYWILSFGGKRAPVQVQDDGILTQAVLAHAPFRQTSHWPKEWDQLPIDQTIEYTSCTEQPHLVPPALSRLMRYLDRIREQCTARLNNDCSRVVFKYADANNDKKLVRTEIENAAQAMILFAALADKETVSSKDAQKLQKDNAATARQVADLLIAQNDRDANGTLDFNEIAENLSPPNIEPVRDALEKSGRLLPSFGLAALALRKTASE